MAMFRVLLCFSLKSFSPKTEKISIFSLQRTKTPIGHLNTQSESHVGLSRWYVKSKVERRRKYMDPRKRKTTKGELRCSVRSPRKQSSYNIRTV